ncbi:protein QUIRKY [Brachypodium distachyon]|uniref:C2 domain-containing protein n=1 Tax=Brachypodium distachyon TaxID=15368 RepID=A0A0Q3S6I0_BRADI|nr:protein QUIRKY [Brachypodium distachyon]KQK20754.1 hypothetical protein BRADI_1g56630v3 [Brachypodium distachyon]|eukprot:XP_014752637.1 protein QUIRKY [Brachypodium distachyon]
MAPAGTVRKLVVEVVEARDLQPKDGFGTSSPYARADFDGQRRKTRTVVRDLNPVWNEPLEFTFPGPGTGVLDPVGGGEPLEVSVLHDLRVGPSRRSTFLGRVRLDARRFFVRKGEEALIYFPLEKKSFFGWVRGEIGLKVYYVDEPAPVPVAPEPEPNAGADPPPAAAAPDAAEAVEEAPPTAPDAAPASADPPPVPTEEAEAPEEAAPPAGEEAGPEKPPDQADTAETVDAPVMTSEAVPASSAEPAAETPPPMPMPMPMPRQVLLPARPAPAPAEVLPVEPSKHDLVDKMPYLFVRVVRARGLPAGAHPHVRVAVAGGGRHASTREARRGAFFEWDQTFAFARDPADSQTGPTMEVSVWDLPPDADVSVADDRSFLGGLCFDTADVHARDPPDGPLATQWYRLEGGRRNERAADLMVATWAGTQADEAFADAWKADSPPAHASSSTATASSSASSSAKVYVSPKLWLLRLTVIEAQDTLMAARADAGIAVRGTLGFQSLKTRTTAAVTRNGGPSWNEDLLFVAAEPFTDGDCFEISLEVRHGKDAFTVGSASVSLGSIERRVDDRKVASKWLDLLPSDEAAATRKANGKFRMPAHVHGGRLHVRVCLDGGYHVADEPPYASSDFRPSARQLWRQPVGLVELGVVGCKGLLPMRAADGKGCTDAYAVAKYGPKWARTRTISDSFDPAWNEQYTWPVYDPCTVLTVGVFDDPPPPPSDDADAAVTPSRPMGKVRIRLSTLENGRVYRGSYPLLMMLPTGAKRMGDVELAVRFATSGTFLDTLHGYLQPSLPPMNNLRPIPAAHREPLRLAAARITAGHLARAEPPLRREVATWMLDAGPGSGSSSSFSMRKLRANWNRAASALTWVSGVARWAEETRTWRSPAATGMAHAVLVLLAWHPDLVIPTLALHVAAVGAWRYRRRPRAPAPHPCVRASMAEAPAEREELDEEFDPVPSARPPETVRARYDRARVVGARLQAMVGDVATQAERVQALVSWRDPRATGMFVALCVALAMVLYVVPLKVVVVVAGFYYLRHPMFRDRTPAPAVNFFRRLPSMAERII